MTAEVPMTIHLTRHSWHVGVRSLRATPVPTVISMKSYAKPLMEDRCSVAMSCCGTVQAS